MASSHDGYELLSGSTALCLSPVWGEYSKLHIGLILTVSSTIGTRVLAALGTFQHCKAGQSRVCGLATETASGRLHTAVDAGHPPPQGGSHKHGREHGTVMRARRRADQDWERSGFGGSSVH